VFFRFHVFVIIFISLPQNTQILAISQ